jgi:methionine-rich copper-binding protein CopC
MNIQRPLVLLALLATSAVAHSHAKLADSLPKPASQLDASPSEIRLQFNETVEPAFSKIRLLDAQNAEIELGKTSRDSTHTNTVFATPPLLHAGQYRVQWSTVTHDGHKTKGEFSFAVK